MTKQDIADNQHYHNKALISELAKALREVRPYVECAAGIGGQTAQLNLDRIDAALSKVKGGEA